MKSTEELSDERWKERNSHEDKLISSAIGLLTISVCLAILFRVPIGGLIHQWLM
jgi:hypothetical protein